MMLLVGLLALNAILHAVVVVRYGASGPNAPFAVFTAVDLLLAIVVFIGMPYALWAALGLSAAGLIGLTMTFNKPQRAKTLDRIIWVVDVLIVAYAAYLLFFRAATAA